VYVSVQLQRKPFSRLQAHLVELKKSIGLFGEVLTEAKKLTDRVEGLFHALERVIVVFVCMVLTIIGAFTMVSWKIDLPHLIDRLKHLLGS